MKQLISIIIMTGLILSAPVVAKTSAKEAAEQSLSAVTVFMDVNKFNRKNLAAKKMTKHHSEFAAYGYELIAVNPYVENGDLEGFFISYKKK